MIVKLTRITNNPILAIEEAACNCYDSKPSSNGKIMDSCYDSGHTSVMEFCNFTFHVEGVSRSLLAQITRHRHAGFEVRSQRFCIEKNIDWIIPKTIQDNPEALKIYNEHHKQTENTYEKLLTLDIPAEDSRYVLDNSCPTIFEFTINLRALINFMNLRLCKNAQWEIKELALRMKNEIIKLYPQFARFLVPKCEVNTNYPFCTERKCCGRHKKLSEVYKL